MMVKIKNLSIGGEPYEAKIILGSLKDGQINVRAAYGECTFDLGASGKWLDMYAANRFHYEITEVEDPSNQTIGYPHDIADDFPELKETPKPAKVEPTAIMEIISTSQPPKPSRDF